MQRPGGIIVGALFFIALRSNGIWNNSFSFRFIFAIPYRGGDLCDQFECDGMRIEQFMIKIAEKNWISTAFFLFSAETRGNHLLFRKKEVSYRNFMPEMQ